MCNNAYVTVVYPTDLVNPSSPYAYDYDEAGDWETFYEDYDDEDYFVRDYYAEQIPMRVSEVASVGLSCLCK